MLPDTPLGELLVLVKPGAEPELAPAPGDCGRSASLRRTADLARWRLQRVAAPPAQPVRPLRPPAQPSYQRRTRAGTPRYASARCGPTEPAAL